MTSLSERTYAFGYYGGKLSHLARLLPLLPTDGVQTYVEPFGGSAAVLLNRPPSPVEVYNDLDGDVVTFFRVLRDAPDALTRAIELTPYSRQEFALACQREPGLPDIETARRFYVRVGQSRYCLPKPTPGNWSYCVSDSDRGMAAGVSAWRSTIDRLTDVARRLLTVQLEHLPALDVIGRYDREDTLIYVDPPYPPEARKTHGNYVHEMTTDDHRALADCLNACQSSVAVSGYDCVLYDELFAGWFKTSLAARTSAASGTTGERSTRQEIVWTNYDPTEHHGLSRLPMFAAQAASE